MASSNSNQGLQIAVACLAALAVILSVTAYLLYSSLTEKEAQLKSAQDAKRTADSEKQQAVNDVQEIARLSGHNTQDGERLKTAISEDLGQTEGQIQTIASIIAATLNQVGNQFDANAGVPADQMRPEDVLNRYTAQNPIQGYSYAQSNDDLIALLDMMARLNANLLGSNISLQSQLAALTSLKDQELATRESQIEEIERERDDLAESNREVHNTILVENRELSRDSRDKGRQIIDLQRDLDDQRSRFEEELRTQKELVVSLRREVERQENVLDIPDGRIVSVDYRLNEVRTTLTRGQGARPRMRFSIFDRDDEGIPSEEVKGIIELTSVNGEFSIGRIIDLKSIDSDNIQLLVDRSRISSLLNPIRPGDLVYSSTWDPAGPEGSPQKFALIGNLDLDRDGRDDRESVIQMIRDAGGEVVFDLPPPNIGKQSGEMAGNIAWYVEDKRKPFRPLREQETPSVQLEALNTYNENYNAAIDQAESLGVRPLALEKLAKYLGYTYGTPYTVQVEQYNDVLADRLLRGDADDSESDSDVGGDRSSYGTNDE